MHSHSFLNYPILTIQLRRALLALAEMIVLDRSMTEKNATSARVSESIDEAVVASKDSSKADLAHKLNWLRAGVLGANDGIMSTSGLLLGVSAAANSTSGTILVAGVAALVAGSISMAGGEYTSVSAQRDSEIAALEEERKSLRENPDAELRELALYYEEKGLSYKLATQVALELTEKDALKAHADAELGITEGEHVSPLAAAISSFVAFAGGSILPLLAMIGPWQHFRNQATIGAVIIALAITGYVGAKIGGAKAGRSVIRNLAVSLLTMGVTYVIGNLVGTHLA
jgi:VIT1/CCC1 family predicted Fe2+/Mn2+ transporter